MNDEKEFITIDTIKRPYKALKANINNQRLPPSLEHDAWFHNWDVLFTDHLVDIGLGRETIVEMIISGLLPSEFIKLSPEEAAKMFQIKPDHYPEVMSYLKQVYPFLAETKGS